MISWFSVVASVSGSSVVVVVVVVVAVVVAVVVVAVVVVAAVVVVVASDFECRSNFPPKPEAMDIRTTAARSITAKQN